MCVLGIGSAAEWHRGRQGPRTARDWPLRRARGVMALMWSRAGALGAPAALQNEVGASHTKCCWPAVLCVGRTEWAVLSTDSLAVL